VSNSGMNKPADDRPASTPWWGRVLAVLAIVCTTPSLIFIPFEQIPTSHTRGGGDEWISMEFFVTGVFGPFFTPVAVLLGLIVLVAPRIRLGLRLGTVAVVAASVPATTHILKEFTAKLH
jgi:hypothetical protein